MPQGDTFEAEPTREGEYGAFDSLLKKYVFLAKNGGLYLILFLTPKENTGMSILEVIVLFIEYIRNRMLFNSTNTLFLPRLSKVQSTREPNDFNQTTTVETYCCTDPAKTC